MAMDNDIPAAVRTTGLPRIGKVPFMAQIQSMIGVLDLI
ncbi:hypothetical protein FHX77_000776 [Bifidobacterium commune]|nr:hypothetical protein [Bifidobacterium commune]